MKNPIAKMFDGIAHRYDFLNHAMSLFQDVRWRRECSKDLLKLKGDGVKALDLCGGTGDFLLTYGKIAKISRNSALGDFSFEMIRFAKKKGLKNVFQLDALNLPFRDESYDVLLNGFGMRNVSDTARGLSEAYRVLAPGGCFMTLEFFGPANAFGKFFYGKLAPLFIPVMGAFFSGHREAYEYLVKSIRHFLPVKSYAELAKRQGFEVKKIRMFDFGIAYGVLLQKPQRKAAK
ncbi:MAG: ubiquinone/menaquinone biosynthesis methyltransferase [Fibrobacteraceae bacterium]|nr:ubiquinone/menaquinone biosynthesis methyltransferase [Fibrobacteraceae bacterium]